MYRSIQRRYRKIRNDIVTLWGSGNSYNSRYFICGFVILGIFTFVSLHVVINVVATTHHYSEVGYFDLYGENLTTCWRSSFVGPSLTSWATNLEQISSVSDFNRMENSQNSVRFDSRPVFKVNQSLSGSYPPIRSGNCVEFVDSYSYLRPFQKRKVTCFPSFMIVGAMKCGTGELMKWLDLHPYLKVIRGPNNKRESHFFSRGLPEELRTNPNRNDILRAYAKQLPLLSLEDAAKLYTFEKSPDYLRSGSSLNLLRNSLPDMRIVIILRNPVYRALSEFSHHCRHRRYVRLLDDVELPSEGTASARSFPRGTVLRIMDSSVRLKEPKGNQSNKKHHFIVDLKDLPFKSYVRLRQPCAINDMVSYFQASSVAVRSKQFTNHSMTVPKNEVYLGVYPDEIENGFFDEQLERVFKIFAPSQVLILLQEDMFRNTYRTLRRVESFLGLPCYDYSQVAYTPDPDSPPVRKATTVQGKVYEYLRGFLSILYGAYSPNSALSQERSSPNIHQVHPVHSITGSNRNELKSVLPSSTGEKLYSQTPKAFQSWLDSVYAGHNRKLMDLLSHHYGWKYTTSRNPIADNSTTINSRTSSVSKVVARQPFVDLIDAHWNIDTN